MNKYWKHWEKICERLCAGNDDNDVVLISAKEIKEITGQEPRLMTKFDSRDDLPKVLSERGVFILPVSNGVYGLVRGDGYHDLEPYKGDIEVFRSSLPFELKSSEYGSSEMQYVDHAYNCGLISKFTGLDRLYTTIRGRKRSPVFSFRVDGRSFPTVQSVQVEVDAGYEGRDEIVLIEAKVGRVENFHVRQLFYPFRFWKSQVPGKKIRPVFFLHSPLDGIYRLNEYEFVDPGEYCSIRPVRSKAYMIEPVSRQVDVFFEMLKEMEPVVDVPAEGSKKWSAPQANDVEKIIRIPYLIEQGHTSAKEVAGMLGFTARQGRYYLKAAQDLGLVDSCRGVCGLSDAGRRFVRLGIDKRSLFLARLMMDMPIVREIVRRLYERRRLGMNDIAGIIEANSAISGSTVMRRARALRSWFWWLYSAVGVIKVGRDGIFV